MILQSTMHTIGRLKVISGYAQLGASQTTIPKKTAIINRLFQTAWQHLSGRQRCTLPVFKTRHDMKIRLKTPAAIRGFI